MVDIITPNLNRNQALGLRPRIERFPQAAATGPVAGVNTRIWAWNGVDVSQFDGAAAAAALYTNPTLAVVASATVPGGNVLRTTATGAGGGAWVWLATTPLVFTGNRRRYLIRILMEALDLEYGGAAVLCDDAAGFYGITLVNGVAGWRARWDNGVWVTDGSTVNRLHAQGAGLGVHALVDIHVDGERFAAAQPRFRLYGKGLAQITNPNTAWTESQPAWGAYPAGWQGLALDRFGISVQAGAGAAPVMDILALEVWTDGSGEVSV